EQRRFRRKARSGPGPRLPRRAGRRDYEPRLGAGQDARGPAPDRPGRHDLRPAVRGADARPSTRKPRRERIPALPHGPDERRDLGIYRTRRNRRSIGGDLPGRRRYQRLRAGAERGHRRVRRRAGKITQRTPQDRRREPRGTRQVGRPLEQRL
ncbi:MAG: hypothetical protein AVDCRST_MAG80-967, partial [uncultured Rubrobacteraceae bacterium]